MKVFQMFCLRTTMYSLVLILMTVPELIVTASNGKMATPYESINYKVILERVYIDGEVSVEEVREKVSSMDEFWKKYNQWQLMDLGDSQIVLRKQIDDISPLLKANGYFGVTSDGILSIFNGKPNQENIIHSFFQIDVGKLESRSQMRILDGIPIRTKDQYKEVLCNFSMITEKK